MKLVLVHGRSQGQRSEQELRDEWIPALQRSFDALGKREVLEHTDIRMPFYGAVLDRLIETPPTDQTVARGPGGDIPDPVQAALLTELAARAGLPDEEIAAQLPGAYVARGPENWEWLHAMGRLLSKRVPWLSEATLKLFLRDVGGYLRRPNVTKAVNDIVQAEFGRGPTVVLGHSLGAVVAYWVLTEFAKSVEVPLLVTVGAPLGIKVVKDYLPRPLGMPEGVGHWLNGADERDPVALHARLDRDTFPADIENVSDIHNPQDNAHDIVGYLSDRVVAQHLASALTT